MQNRGETNIDEASIAENLPEQEILIQSVCETMVPKLVAEDIPLLFSLLNDVFPNVNYTRAEMKGIYYIKNYILISYIFSIFYLHIIIKFLLLCIINKIYIYIYIFIGLKDQIRKVCMEEYLVCGEGDEQGGAWQEKVI